MTPRHALVPAGLILLLCAVMPGAPAPGKDDWAPISPEELALKDNPASPGSHAMILYRESSIEAKDSLATEYFRIKIFDEEGKKHADIELPFIKGQEDIRDIHARTVKPDGSVVNFDGKVFEKVIVKAGGIKYLARTFTLPDVQPGCIIEYKYKQQFDPNYYISIEWTVQQDLFTRLGHFSIHPYAGPQAPALLWRQIGLSAGAKLDKQKDGSFQLEVRDIPGLEEEDYMPPVETLRARVDFFYRSQDEPYNETTEQYWKRIGKKWNEGFEKFVNKKGPLEQALAQTVSPNDSQEIKLPKIYLRAQQIRNPYREEKTAKEEKRENLKPNNNVEDVLKRGYGTARDINFLFVAMARSAGFEASEVFVGPRNRVFFNPNIQEVGQLTTDVAWVRLGTQDLYLDPASQDCPYGLLPWYETNVKGLRIGKDGGTIVTTTNPRSTDAVLERHAEFHLTSDGSLEGKLQANFVGQRALDLREDARDADDTGRRKLVADRIKEWMPAGSNFELTSLTGWEGSSESLRAEGTVRIPGFAMIAGHRMLFPVGVFQAGQKALFQHATRVNAVYFPYPFQVVDDITVALPEGCRVETLPAAQKTPQGIVMYELTSRQDGKAVRITRHETVEGIFFPVQYYQGLRTFFSNMKANDEQQAVLQTTGAGQGN